jgi:hypothetical protein
VGAQELIELFSKKGVLSARPRTELLELIVDGYAHVLALDVNRRRLEREIAQLAQSGEPHAKDLRGLSAQLTEVTSLSDRLRGLLDELRAREARGA